MGHVYDDCFLLILSIPVYLFFLFLTFLEKHPSLVNNIIQTALLYVLLHHPNFSRFREIMAYLFSLTCFKRK